MVCAMAQLQVVSRANKPPREIWWFGVINLCKLILDANQLLMATLEPLIVDDQLHYHK